MSVDPRSKALDHAFKLVGEYFFNWAFMEGRLNDLIGTLLGMDELQRLVACANLMFRNKITIAKSAISLIFPPASEEVEHFCRVLNQIDNAAQQERNTLAHQPFGVADDAKEFSVKWYKVSARDKLHFPKIIWTETEFYTRFYQLDAWATELDKISKACSERRLVIAMLDTGEPTQQNALLGLLGSQPPLQIPPHNSDIPNANQDTSLESSPQQERE